MLHIVQKESERMTHKQKIQDQKFVSTSQR